MEDLSTDCTLQTRIKEYGNLFDIQTLCKIVQILQHKKRDRLFLQGLEVFQGLLHWHDSCSIE